MQVLAANHATPKFLFYFYHNICWKMARKHTKQLIGKILAIKVLQCLKSRQQLVPSKAAYSAAQILFMGSENIFLHSTAESWKNKVSMK